MDGWQLLLFFLAPIWRGYWDQVLRHKLGQAVRSLVERLPVSMQLARGEGELQNEIESGSSDDPAR